MRKPLVITVAIAFGVVAVTPGAAAAHARSQHKPLPTVTEILLSDSAKDDESGFDHRWYDFDIFTQMMYVFDYERDVLDGYEGSQLTLFIPTDYAFYRLAKQHGAPPKLTELETYNWLFENVRTGPIEDTLLMHFTLDSISYRELLQSHGEELGTGVEVRVRSGKRVQLIDFDPDDRDPYVIHPNFGGRASNGYIHGLGRVLRPFDMD